MIKIEGEEKLLKLTSTLLIDFLKTHIEEGTEIDRMTLFEIVNYCRIWIEENVKETR